jgi:putative endonuclease
LACSVLVREPRTYARREALSTTRTGGRFERRAALHYRLRGYRIIGTNVWAGGNELDLIVRRGRRLVFCEIKGKHTASFGHPLEMVTPEKRRRVRRAAESWFAAHPECHGLDCSFEVVGIRGRTIERWAVDL